MEILRVELYAKYFHGGQVHIRDQDYDHEPFKALMINSLLEK